MKVAVDFFKKHSFDLSPQNLKSKPEFTHSLWTVGGQVLVSLIAFLMTYVLANYVSESVVGSFRYVLALYGGVSALALIGMNNALMQSVAAGKTGSYRLAVQKKIQYGFIGTIVLGAVAAYYGIWEGNIRMGQTLFLLALVLPWLEAFSLFGPYLNGVSHFKYTSIFLTIERALTSALVIVIALIQPSLLVITGSYFALRLIVAWYLYRRSLHIAPPNAEVDEGMMPYAKHITVMNMLGIVTSQLDKYILFFFFGPVSLAAFWVASIIPQEVGRFQGVVLSTFFPRMVQAGNHQTVFFARKAFIFLIGIGLVCMALYAVVAQLIFALLLPKYLEAVTMSVVLMIAYAIIPHTMVWSFFTAKKKVRELYMYSVGEPLLVVLLYALFVPVWGVWGMVYAVCARTLILNIVGVWLLFGKKYENS